MWKNNSLINLHLLTGQIGKPGAGPFSLTGQPNAMGGREAGLLAEQLPGYRFVEDAGHRAEVEAYWGPTGGHHPPAAGADRRRDVPGAGKRRLKAIWIAGTNPLVSLPDLHQVAAGSGPGRAGRRPGRLPPDRDDAAGRRAAAGGPVGREGVDQYQQRAARQLQSAESSTRRARRCPTGRSSAGSAGRWACRGFDFDDAAEVWDEFRRPDRGPALRHDRHHRPPRCGRTPRLLAVPERGRIPALKRRYLDSEFPTPDGRARFLPRDHRPPREGTDHEFPFVLTTGRLYAHWHTLTRTAKCAKLVLREPGPYVEVHPADAARLGVSAGELVQLSSRRGTIRLPARLSDEAAPGTVFVPFHWGDLFAPANAANYLTISATDTLSKQPELKFCAVALEKVQLEPEVTAPTSNGRPLLVPVVAEFLDGLPTV